LKSKRSILMFFASTVSFFCKNTAYGWNKTKKFENSLEQFSNFFCNLIKKCYLCTVNLIHTVNFHLTVSEPAICRLWCY
jgi:hypothetical protein